MDTKPITIPPLIEAAVEILRPAAEAKSITIDTKLDPAAEPIWGDSARLQQVLWNILSNAIKFTPKEGRIGVRCERADSNVMIVVEASGIRIRPKFVTWGFERLRQAGATSPRCYGRLGP